jgi:hypothetical protein
MAPDPGGPKPCGSCGSGPPALPGTVVVAPETAAGVAVADPGTAVAAVVVAVPGTVVGEGVDPHDPGDPSQTPELKRKNNPHQQFYSQKD